jgi:hypothetical protein
VSKVFRHKGLKKQKSEKRIDLVGDYSLFILLFSHCLGRNKRVKFEGLVDNLGRFCEGLGGHFMVAHYKECETDTISRSPHLYIHISLIKNQHRHQIKSNHIDTDYHNRKSKCHSFKRRCGKKVLLQIGIGHQ